MAVLLGRIDQFDPKQEERAQYMKLLVQFVKVNDIMGEDICVTFKLCSSCSTVAVPYSENHHWRVVWLYLTRVQP